MNPSELVKGCHSFLYDDGQEKVYCGGIDVFAHIPVYCKRCKARMEQALFDYKKFNDYQYETPEWHTKGIEILEKALNIHNALNTKEEEKRCPGEFLGEFKGSPSLNNQGVKE